jgi:hypothetical protein
MLQLSLGARNGLCEHSAAGVPGNQMECYLRIFTKAFDEDAIPG